ncbi:MULTISPECIES: hypothetical protein [Methylobacterium]|jgi:hypothetical protein|uniref:Uncharacterized protein n=3 Tax=Pseudomonadota TaxID=1224 RepID=A0ABQ4SY42_9HYPH|nr:MULTISPECIES: hypothetical protein [Methylobacterium]PIU05667.1 MAG: hypothetical protein COT56_13565 [Methylobacterium sp. CG09_land_8_20_14_0_10_71_15]PIU12377.1 MAG: hypothetical protein COT28_15410 [Methylobacterium sp. CG08_land_8_20_14_0_20_71_15]GBU16889.1 hypothetical protein AwMethylo_11040 [Methylobacterium sp.]GJE06843.1 hypothetical protein AOPFMNJM_2165 [Methylobacterium jeotgali]
MDTTPITPHLAEEPGFEKRMAAKKPKPPALSPEMTRFVASLPVFPDGAAVPLSPYKETKLFDEAQAYAVGAKAAAAIQVPKAGELLDVLGAEWRAKQDALLAKCRMALEAGQRVVLTVNGAVVAVYDPHQRSER